MSTYAEHNRGVVRGKVIQWIVADWNKEGNDQIVNQMRELVPQIFHLHFLSIVYQR